MVIILLEYIITRLSVHVPFLCNIFSPPFSICYRFNERYNKESFQVNNSCVVIPIQYLFSCSYKVYFQRITLFSLNNQKNYRRLSSLYDIKKNIFYNSSKDLHINRIAIVIIKFNSPFKTPPVKPNPPNNPSKIE